MTALNRTATQINSFLDGIPDAEARENLKENLGIKNLVENQMTGVKVFESLADLPGTGIVNTSYKVANDSTEANNGYYHWDGAQYVKDSTLAIGKIESGNADSLAGGKAYNLAMAEFKAWLKSYDPTLTAYGLVKNGDVAPSAVLNRAYRVIEDGTAFGYTVSKGDLLTCRDVSTGYKIEALNTSLLGIRISYLTDRRYIAAITDTEGRILFAVTKTGKLEFKNAEIEALQDRITDIEARVTNVEALEDQLTAAEASIVINSGSIDTLSGLIDALTTLVDANSTSITALQDVTTHLRVISDRRFSAAFTDDSGKVLLGIRKGSGKVTIQLEEIDELQSICNALDDRVTETEGRLDSAELDLSNIKLVTSLFSLLSDRRFSGAIVDAEGKVLQGFGKDGLVSFPKQRLINSDNNDRRYLYGILDNERRVLFGITKAGKIEVNSGSVESLFKTVESHETRIYSLELLLDVLKKVYCWGDSLTAGAGGGGTTYPSVLQSNLGSDYLVTNCGVGGENVRTIPARQGGIPMMLPFNITIPADTDTYVTVATKETGDYFKSVYDDGACTPLYQGAGNSVNPVFIDGIECTLSVYSPTSQTPIYSATDATWRIKRNAAGTARDITAGTLVFMYGAQYRNAFANVFFIGQNGGWTAPEDLSERYDQMITFSGTENYVILGLHSGDASSRADLEDYFTRKYGLHYINLRKYMVEHGLEDAGLTATQADLDAIAVGSCPPQLLADSVHFVAAGYQLIGNLIYNVYKQVGII